MTFWVNWWGSPNDSSNFTFNSDGQRKKYETRDACIFDMTRRGFDGNVNECTQYDENGTQLTDNHGNPITPPPPPPEKPPAPPPPPPPENPPAPPPPCPEGKTRKVNCPKNGREVTQLCVGGEWINKGPCDETEDGRPYNPVMAVLMAAVIGMAFLFLLFGRK